MAEAEGEAETPDSLTTPAGRVMRGVRSWILLSAMCASACTPRDDDIARYIAARGGNKAAADPLWAKGAVDSAIVINDAFVRTYGPVLKRIVGPLDMQGLSDSVDMHIGTQGVYDNTPVPDGFLYRTTDSVQVFVTDTALLNAYGAQELNTTGLSALLGLDIIASQLFAVDAGSYDCGEVPGVRGAATARLIEYSQDKAPGCNPEYVAVTVLSGRRLLAAQQTLASSSRANSQQVTALAQSLVDRLRTAR